MSEKLVIDPVTRLEGHGKIHLLLNDSGEVDRAYFQAPDFKGFEKFCEGRAAEEMPALTQKICGVCPMAHHTASVKALDRLFGVRVPETAETIRRLAYNAFVFEDHMLHFFFLGGVDFIVGPDAPRGARNFAGVVDRLGKQFGKRILHVRKTVREVTALVGGSAVYPVHGVAGGVLKPLEKKDRKKIVAIADEAVSFAETVLNLFDELFLRNRFYSELLKDENYWLRTYRMGMVDDAGMVDFYDGRLGVTPPGGGVRVEFQPEDYHEWIAERVDPESYVKPVYLKRTGWRGLREGADSGIFQVGPLARLNVADGMSTPGARKAYDRMFDMLGGKPVHSIFANHWARLIEALCAAESMVLLARDEKLVGHRFRNMPERPRGEGVGICEAPRGTLVHHYKTDSNAVVEKCILISATQNNMAAINMAVEKAAKAVIEGGVVSEAQTCRIETAFRAFDPCMACAAHTVEIEGGGPHRSE